MTDYLDKSGLQPYLDQLGFQIVGYGCTTCIGNSGPLHPKIEEAITEHDLIAASVLSGNRNFEARVHQNIKANFLMSPPLVVAFALAGRGPEPVHRSHRQGPRGTGRFPARPVADAGRNPSGDGDGAQAGSVPQQYVRDFAEQNPKWNEIPSTVGDTYVWDVESDYIQEPPFFLDFGMEPGTHRGDQGRACAGDFRGFRDDRPHLAGRRDQAHVARR